MMHIVRKHAFLLLLVLVVALPLTVIATQQIVSMRQEAATVDETTVMPNNYIMISGYVYVDANKNAERDLGEKGYPAAILDIKQATRNSPTIVLPTSAPPTPGPTNVLFSTPMPDGQVVLPLYQTDAYGYFKYKVASQNFPSSVNYAIALRVPFGYKMTTKNPLYLNDLHRKSKKIIEFGITPSNPIVMTPTPGGCARGLADVSYGTTCTLDSQTTGYRQIKYACLDGSTGVIGEATSCKPAEVLKQLALEACTGIGCPVTPTPTCTPRPRCLDSEPRCQIKMPVPAGGWCPQASPTPIDQVCTQAFTWGRNIATKQCKLFSTSCMSEGWVADPNCGAVTDPIPSPTKVSCPTPPTCKPGESIAIGDPVYPNQCPIYACVSR